MWFLGGLRGSMRTWTQGQRQLYWLSILPRSNCVNKQINCKGFSSEYRVDHSGQDRITSDGELMITHRQAQPRQQAGSMESPTSSPAGPGASTAPILPPLTSAELEQLTALIHSSRRLVVLTGAGCSTESDIPDYRGPNGAYSTGFKPMTHQQFMASAQNRSRYWSRSFAGWYRFSRVQPNAAHEGLARLQAAGWAKGLITQNVDRLHQKAGSRGVLELHGTTHEVVCTACGELSCREEFQRVLEDLNPEAAAAAAALMGQGVQQAQHDDALRMLRAGTAQPVDLSLREQAPALRPDGEQEPPSSPALHPRPDGDAELEHPAGRWRPHKQPAAVATSAAQSSQALASSSHSGTTSGTSHSSPHPGTDSSEQGSSHRPPSPAPQPAPPPRTRPDGDAELDPMCLTGPDGGGFRVPPCPSCGGVLKPHVVFFGDSIPPQRAQQAQALAESADAVLVVGSSVQVYSAFRLVKGAKEGGARLALLTAGPTRADALLGPGDLKFDALAGGTLARLAAHPSLLLPAPC